MQCINCKIELTGKQTRFCSKKCNMAYTRNGNSPTVTEPALAVTTVTERPPAVTDDLAVTELEQPDITALPGGVVRPTGLRTEETSDMSACELSLDVRVCSGLTWINSPAYAEVIFRLQTWTVKQLEEHGHMIPAWKAVA